MMATREKPKPAAVTETEYNPMTIAAAEQEPFSQVRRIHMVLCDRKADHRLLCSPHWWKRRRK
jgi:hypothetical protein